MLLNEAVWFGNIGSPVGGHEFNGVVNGTVVPGGVLCTATPNFTLDTEAKVLGGFWSGISSITTGKGKAAQRSDLNQAKMQLAQQLLAAILNNEAFGSSPSGGVSIPQAIAAFCGTDLAAVKLAAQKMAAFNESGDNGAFTPGTNAQGKQAKDAADLAYWDLLPPNYTK
jgi:hypothetical protein